MNNTIQSPSNCFDRSETLSVENFLHPSASYSSRQRSSLLRPNTSASVTCLSLIHSTIFSEGKKKKPGQTRTSLAQAEALERARKSLRNIKAEGRREARVQTGTIWPAASETDTLKGGGPRAGPESTGTEPHRRHKSLPLANDI